MICFRHEESNVNFEAFRSKPRAPFVLCPKNPGGLYWVKDSGFVADIGGSASGVDNRGIGADASEFESMDAQSKPRRGGSLKNKTQAWTPSSIGSEDCLRIGGSVKKVSPRFWDKSNSVGWPDPGGSPESTLWHKDKSASGSVLASSIGLPFKKGELHLFAGSARRSQRVSEGIKKNFKILSLGRLLFLKMKRGLPCIPGWVEDGPNVVCGCVFPPIASTVRGSIFLDGWLLFWGELV